MIKSGIDASALVDQFAQATAKQGEALRKAVSEATLKALQGRELTLDNIRKVLKTVTDAASAGAAKSGLPSVDVRRRCSAKAFAGMDAAAAADGARRNRKALQQFVDQGIGLQDKQMKSAMANLEKMEDMFFKAIGSSAKSAERPCRGRGSRCSTAMKMKGTAHRPAGRIEHRGAHCPGADGAARGAQRRYAQCAGADGELRGAGQRRADRHVRCAAAAGHGGTQGRADESTQEGMTRSWMP